MPQLLIRGIPIEDMRQISQPLIAELADICKCSTDNFMIECLHTTSVFGGKVVQSYPFIEVGWFERGQEIRDRFAQAITSHVMAIGVKEVEIAFITYREESYYWNGKHF